MSPGKRPKRLTIGIEDAAQIAIPHATTINPIMTIAFPNGAMAMHLLTASIVPAGAANRDWVWDAQPAPRRYRLLSR
jgi:hypothetical protein